MVIINYCKVTAMVIKSYIDDYRDGREDSIPMLILEILFSPAICAWCCYVAKTQGTEGLNKIRRKLKI